MVHPIIRFSYKDYDIPNSQYSTVLFKKFTLNMVMNTLRLDGSLFRFLFNVFLLKID